MFDRPRPRPRVLALLPCLAVACARRGDADEPGDAPPPSPAMQAVFDPAAHGPGAPPPPLPAAPLTIVDVGPRGRASGGGEIHVRFAQPVAALGLEEAAEGLIALDPPVAGRSRWKAPDLLVFDPDDALPLATRFTARVTAPLAASDGRRVDPPPPWSFETPRPQVESGGLLNLDARARDLAPHRRTAAYVVFDQPTTLAEVKAHLRAYARPLAPSELDGERDREAEEGASAARVAAAVKVEAITPQLHRRHRLDDEISLPEAGAGYLITPVGLWPGASRITIEVGAGVHGQRGPLPSDTPWSRSFDTYGPQAIVERSCADGELCPLAPLTYRLRNPIRARELKKITVSPRPKALDVSLVDAWDDDEGGRELLIEGIFLPGKTYTVTIGGQVRDVYGQALGSTFTHAATLDRAPSLGISDTAAILRASGPRTFGVTTRHLRAIEVRATRLGDAAVAALLRRRDLTGVGDLPPATTRRIELQPKGPTDWSEIAVDLADLVGDHRGAVLVEVVPLTPVPEAADRPPPEPVRGVFRITDMGAIASLSGPRSVLQVVDLSRGGAIAGASVEHRVGDRVTPLGTTDDRGIVELPGTAAWPCGDAKKSANKSANKTANKAANKATTPGAPAEPPRLARCEGDLGERDGLLVVRDPKTRDAAYLPIDAASALWGGSTSKALRAGESLIQRVITERGAYRPGEEIHAVGWTAVATPFAPSGLRRLRARTPVLVEAHNPRGEVVASAEVTTTGEGKYSATLTLPEHAPLGRYTVRATIDGASTQADVKVEDYRTPEFQVEARVERPDVIAGDDQRVLVQASYYFGGPVAITSARHNSECQPTRYRPPGLEATWAVGARPPRSRRRAHTGAALPRPSADAPALDGALDFPVRAHRPGPGLAERCLVSVEIRDASLQGIGAETSYLAHSAPFYLAIGLPERAPRAGDRHDPPLRAVDLEGRRVAAAKVAIKIERTWDEPVYREEDGRKVLYGHKARTQAVTACTLDLREAGDDARCKLPPLAEGTYTITASAQDGARETLSEASFWVRPRRGPDVTWSVTPPARLEIETSVQTVRPGDPVAVRVRAPWSDAPALLLIERAGIREARPLALGLGGAEITLTADDTWTPAIHLEAIAVRPPAAGALPRVETARTSVAQDQEHRRLAVRVEAPPEIGPGDRARVAVDLRDADGSPTAGRVALWMVDEAVLALTDYEVPDLLPSFNARAGADTSQRHDFASLRLPFVPGLEDPWLFEGGRFGSGSGYGSGYGAGGGARLMGGAASVAPPARARFKTTPVFLADLAIDGGGRRVVEVEAPENLTTFRIFAVASSRLVDGESPGRFGVGDTQVRVTKPLVLRAALPRGLRPGDRAEIAAILQNRSGAAGTVEVRAQVIGEAPGVALVGPQRARVAIAGDGQVRLPFTIVAERPGTPEIELQAALVGQGGGVQLHDGMRVPVPVEAERTQIERVAMYGTLADDQPIGVPVRLPQAVLPGLGGVTVSTTSTLLGGLEDAIHELIHYPYGCVEQTASRLLPLVAIRDLKNQLPLAVDVDALMAAGVERLLSMQVEGGGFSYWPGGQTASPYASAYATWVLQRAERAGHPVPQAALDRALDYLAREATPSDAPQGYDDLGEIRRAIAVHALADGGRAAPEAIRHLFERRQRLPLFARAFLLMAMKATPGADEADVEGLTSELLGSLAETPGSAHAHETVAYDLGEVFHSDGRSDAIVLMALLRVRPDHPVIPKLVRGVMDRRDGGAWRNTQENAYALAALADYVEIYEKEVPDLVARAWVGRMQLLDAVFRGRDARAQGRTMAMGPLLAGLAGGGDQAPDLVPVILQRQGVGRLYYRIGAEWAPAGVDLPERSQGLAVARALRTRDGVVAPGAAIPPGETVAVDIQVRADTRTPFVAVEVPIPSGLEPIQRELGRGQRAMNLAGARGPWVSYEELRRDRVVLFADDLPPGEHHHSAFLRATTPGEYRVPPAVAEAMYTPEIYGRSSATAVRITSP